MDRMEAETFITVQTVKLGRERFVIVREKDFRDLEKRARTPAKRRPGKLSAQDRGDIAEALRRLANSGDKEVLYSHARKRLGLL